MTGASDVNVGELMHKWTRDIGYPVLSVSREGENNEKLRIVQKRFLKSGKEIKEATPWHVFIRVAGDKGIFSLQLIFSLVQIFLFSIYI